MIISCVYEELSDNPMENYGGFTVSDPYNEEVKKIFKSDNPPKDYRNASDYAEDNGEMDVVCSSSIDNFVSDCKQQFGWYTNEFGEEWFDYIENLPMLKKESQEKREQGIKTLLIYFQTTMGVNDALAAALAEATYLTFGKHVLPILIKHQQSAENRA